jgi:hypothetical protein
MLKAIHAQESRDAADRKARAIVDDLRAAKMNTAADLVERSVSETLTYYAFFVNWATLRIHSFVRPRHSSFFRPGRRSRSRRAQGRSTLAAFAATPGLALTGPSTEARWRGRDCIPRLPGTCPQWRLWFLGAGDLVAKRGASAESVTGPPDHVLPS